MKLRAKKPMMYMSRMLQAGDEFEPMAGDVRYLMGRNRTEVVSDDEPTPKRRGRPPRHTQTTKSEAEPHDQLEEKTVPELRELAEERGVELPSGYVRKDELVDMISDEDDR